MNNDPRGIAAAIYAQFSGAATAQWEPDEWTTYKSALLRLISVEDSALRLGDVLRLDAGLEMPVEVVRATYHRLFELGATDDRTRLCYARYLLLHGPDWDEEAQRILDDVEASARAAGIWDSPVLGHHPVLCAGED